MKRINYLSYFILFLGLNLLVFLIESQVSGICMAQDVKTHQDSVKMILDWLTDTTWDTDPTETMRAYTALQLGHAKDTIAVNPLIYVLRHDKYNDLRATAAWALGKIGDKRAIPVLYEMMDDKNMGVQAKALSALVTYFGIKDDEKILSKLEDIARGKGQDTWETVGFVPYRLSDNEKLIQGAKDAFRNQAIRTLYGIKTERTIKLLESIANNPDEPEKVRKIASATLRMIKK